MYRIHLFFDWIDKQLGWIVLGIFVLAGTAAISLYFSRRRIR